jgi:hypothetical protein
MYARASPWSTLEGTSAHFIETSAKSTTHLGMITKAIAGAGGTA